MLLCLIINKMYVADSYGSTAEVLGPIMYNGYERKHGANNFSNQYTVLGQRSMMKAILLSSIQ